MSFYSTGICVPVLPDFTDSEHASDLFLCRAANEDFFMRNGGLTVAILRASDRDMASLYIDRVCPNIRICIGANCY
jgi:hypothetical protein